MKIAIVSDSHDNMNNLTKVLDYLENKSIKILVHCGDLTSSEILEKLSEFQGKVYLVEGNAETYQVQNLNLKINGSSRLCSNNKEILKHPSRLGSRSKAEVQGGNLIFFGRIGEVKVDGVKIGFAHRPLDVKALLKKDYDFVFYGHTHKPWIEMKRCKDREIFVANPGNIMGQPYEPTFAILDTKYKKLELVGVEKI